MAKVRTVFWLAVVVGIVLAAGSIMHNPESTGRHAAPEPTKDQYVRMIARWNHIPPVLLAWEGPSLDDHKPIRVEANQENPDGWQSQRIPYVSGKHYYILVSTRTGGTASCEIKLNDTVTVAGPKQAVGSAEIECEYTAP